jgi:hypothetical protein
MSIIAALKKGDCQNVKFRTKRRDSENETPDLASNDLSVLDLKSRTEWYGTTFSEDKKIPFQFTIKMPPPRYYPMILERDKKGRILKSEFPPLSYK